MKHKLFILIFLLAGATASAQHFSRPYPDTLNKRRLGWTIAGESAFYLGGMSFLGWVWYSDVQRVPFHWYNDNAGYLQMDKMGHVYGSYLESYIGYHALRRAGVKRNTAIWLGGTLGFWLQFPIEVFDGLYEGWGFSWGDVVANGCGSALVMGQEWLFDEQILRYKFSYWRSDLATQANGYLGRNFFESLFYDYNGHTYWLSAPINRTLGLENVPEWLCFSVGYSADGMLGEFANRSFWGGQRLPEVERTRQFLFSLDIDTSRIPAKRKWVRVLLDGLAFVKVPFPALEINSQGQFRGYGLYF